MEPAQVRVLAAPSPRRPAVAVWAALVAVLAAAILLRLIFPGDIEFNNDQLWLFNLTQQAGRGMPWPWLGLPSSAQVAAPGLSVWTFVAMARLGGIHTPIGLGLAVKLLNLVAIVLLIGFAYFVVEAPQRELWLWAAAFEAVNPVCVWLERKIWQPSIFPIFTVVFLALWWRRARPRAAFGWGLMGALLGQVQGSGFFFAAGLALWAWLFDRRNAQWRAWLCGSIIGALPMVPWIIYMARELGRGQAPHSRWINLLDPRFYTAWFSLPFGLNLHDPLGRDFYSFLRYPLIGQMPSYGAALLHLMLLAIGCWILGRGAIRLWQDRGSWRTFIVGRESQTAFTQQAALLGFGGLMTLSGLPGHIHYLVIAFPLIFVWLARTVLHDTALSVLAPGGRQKLALLWVVEFLLSLMFLLFIHQNHGAPGGDFGVVCRNCGFIN